MSDPREAASPDPAGPFSVNAPDVIWEEIDGEVVLINLESGTYYSAEGTGAAIWRLVESGRSADEAARALGRAWEGDPADIREGVRVFLSRLIEEGLVVPEARPRPDGPARDDPPADGGRPRFTPPRLEKYADMRDILLLDPVHDAGDRGWPEPGRGDGRDRP